LTTKELSVLLEQLHGKFASVPLYAKAAQSGDRRVFLEMAHAAPHRTVQLMGVTGLHFIKDQATCEAAGLVYGASDASKPSLDTPQQLVCLELFADEPDAGRSSSAFVVIAKNAVCDISRILVVGDMLSEGAMHLLKSWYASDKVSDVDETTGAIVWLVIRDWAKGHKEESPAPRSNMQVPGMPRMIGLLFGGQTNEAAAPAIEAALEYQTRERESRVYLLLVREMTEKWANVIRQRVRLQDLKMPRDRRDMIEATLRLAK